MDNILTIKERILQLAKNQGYTIEDFCEKIGMTYGNLKGANKKTPINSNAIVNILSIIPNMNLLWLITGRGEMLSSNYENMNILKDRTANYTQTSDLSELKANYDQLKDKYISTIEQLSQAKEEIYKLKEEIAAYKTRKLSDEQSKKRYG